MIQKVQLTKSGLVTSRLGFGTSRLHYLDRRARGRLLDLAADLGFTHFDTAPSYGDTLAEHELGNAMRSRRARFIIATKYGIEPNPIIALAPSFAQPMRGAMAIARRFASAQSKHPPITAKGLRQSVEQSLRRLQTDWVDILFLHEPSPDSLKSAEAVFQELLDLREEGAIRYFGLAGAWKELSELGDFAEKIGQVVQTGEYEWPESHPPDITYGAISARPQSFTASSIEPTIALTRLRKAVSRRTQGVVLVSTTDPHRLLALAEASGTFFE